MEPVIPFLMPFLLGFTNFLGKEFVQTAMETQCAERTQCAGEQYDPQYF